MKRYFGVKASNSKGKWAICDVCGLHKEGVQIRKAHLKDKWVCNDCYDKAKQRDALNRSR